MWLAARILLLTSIIIFSCNQDNSCKYTSDILLSSEKEKVFGTWKENNKITEFRDKGLDSVRGGYYTFYNSGEIERYTFFGDRNYYTFQEKRSKNGSIENIEGNPFVWTVISTKKDTLEFESYLFGLLRTYLDVKVELSDTSFEVTPVRDSIYSNMYIARFRLQKNLLINDSVFLATEMFDFCTRQRSRIYDTIILKHAL